MYTEESGGTLPVVVPVWVGDYLEDGLRLLDEEVPGWPLMRLPTDRVCWQGEGRAGLAGPPRGVLPMPTWFMVPDDLPCPNRFESLPERRAWGRLIDFVSKDVRGFRGRATAVVDGIAVDVQEAWGRRAWVCDQEEAATEGGRAGRPRLACAVDVSELDDVVMSRVPLTLFNNNAERQGRSWKEPGFPGARLEVGAAQTGAAERAGAEDDAWEPGGAAGGADGAGLPVTVLAPPRGPRRPSPSGPVPAAAEEAHARAQEYLARWLADHGGSRLEITLAGLGTLLQAEVRVTIDGRQGLVALHGATAGAIERLRETRAEPGRGAWTRAWLQMDAADGVLHADYDWLARPCFQHPGVAPVEYANELRLFPRDSDNVPTWMAVGASAYEDVTPHPPAESPEPPSPPAGPVAAAGRPGLEGRLPGSAAPLVDPGRMLRKIEGRSVTDLTWWPTGMVVDPAFGMRAGGDGLGLHAGDFCADTGYQAVPRPDGRWVRVAPLSAPCPEGFSRSRDLDAWEDPGPVTAGTRLETTGVVNGERVEVVGVVDGTAWIRETSSGRPAPVPVTDLRAVRVGVRCFTCVPEGGGHAGAHLDLGGRCAVVAFLPDATGPGPRAVLPDWPDGWTGPLMAGTYEWVDGLLWQSYLAPEDPPKVWEETLIGFAPFTVRCPNGFAPDRPNGYGLPGRWAGVLRKEEVVSTDRLVVRARASWRGAPAAVRAVVGTAARLSMRAPGGMTVQTWAPVWELEDVAMRLTPIRHDSGRPWPFLKVLGLDPDLPAGRSVQAALPVGTWVEPSEGLVVPGMAGDEA